MAKSKITQKELNKLKYKFMPFEATKEKDNYFRISKSMYENEKYKSLSIQAKGLYEYLKYNKFKGYEKEKIYNYAKWELIESNYFTFAETEQEKAVEYLQICTKTQKKALKELIEKGFIEKVEACTKNGKNFNSKTQQYEANKYFFSKKWWN